MPPYIPGTPIPPAEDSGRAYTPKIRLKSKTLTAESWDTMLAAYRERPADVPHAAKVARVTLHIADRAWRTGWEDAYPAISELVAAEQIEARLARDRAEADLARKQRASAAEVEAERAAALRRDAIKARTDEGQMITASRTAAMGALAVSANLLGSLYKIAPRVQEAISASDLSVVDYVRLVQRLGGVTRQATDAAEASMRMERLMLGEPTHIVGIAGSGNMSRDEALEELREAARLLEGFGVPVEGISALPAPPGTPPLRVLVPPEDTDDQEGS